MNSSKVRPKKICIVTPLQYGGGAEYQIHCLINALVPREKYDIYYIVRHTDESIDASNYRLVQIGRNGHVPKLGYLMDAKKLMRTLNSIGPDLIYQRVACGYTGICAFYAIKNNVPLIWHVAHDSDVSRGSLFYGRNPVRRFIEKRSIEYGIRNARYVVTQTSQQANLLSENYGRTTTAIIRNFQPEPDEVIDKAEPVTVLWVANLKPWKRPEFFVRLAAKLRDLNQVRFVMIGSPANGRGDRAWSAELMRSIKETPNLDYLGSLSQKEVNSLLARAHVFVNTSYQEGFPNTFIQAWMRQVPVVSLSVSPDNVLDQENIGVFAKTEERMAEAVRAYATDGAKRAEIGMRARDYALREHSLRNASLLADLIDRSAK